MSRDAEPPGPTPVNLRNFSVKCGVCGDYQTLCGYRTADGWNVYGFECESGVCDPAATRTEIEVPVELDEFAQRDPTWRHGKSGHEDSDQS